MTLLIVIGVIAAVSTWLFMNGEYQAERRANQLPSLAFTDPDST